MAEKKILLLTTGGTIASVPSEEGLVPGESGRSLLQVLGKLPYQVDVHDILQLDSSNIQPEEWQLMARYIYDHRLEYDGIVLSHGTDTMAYTASMLSFMLQGIEIPVVMTGSQVPIVAPLSDAPDNLHLAFEAAAACQPGVYLAFNNKVMLGSRSVKVRTTDFNAFESVNVPPVATVSADGLVFNRQVQLPPARPNTCTVDTQIETHVSLVKLFPGFDPQLLFAMVQSGCKGIVVEAFGMGGVNFIRRNLAEAIGQLVQQGIPIVATSQCLYEGTDLTRYEVGVEMLSHGAIPAFDMTSEAAITKLMWSLGQGMDMDAVKKIFRTNLVGEVTIDPEKD